MGRRVAAFALVYQQHENQQDESDEGDGPGKANTGDGAGDHRQCREVGDAERREDDATDCGQGLPGKAGGDVRGDGYGERRQTQEPPDGPHDGFARRERRELRLVRG